MTRSELTMLLAGITGRVPADSVVDDVLVRSEGNPFYAEELLAVGTGAGAPDSVRDAILARVARLAGADPGRAPRGRARRAARSTIGCCRRCPDVHSSRSAKRCARPSPTTSWCRGATGAASGTP